MSDVCINGRINNNYRYGTKRYNPNTATEVWHRDNGKCWDDFNFRFSFFSIVDKRAKGYILVRSET